MDTFPGFMYIHGDKGTSREYFIEDAATAGIVPTEKAKENAAYVAHEVKIEGHWDDEGNFWAQTVAGTRLSKPTKI